MTFKTLAALLVASALFGSLLWRAWTRGKIGMGAHDEVERKNSPISFWLCVAAYSIGLFLTVGAMVDLAIKAISN